MKMELIVRMAFTIFVLLCLNSAFVAGATAATNSPVATSTLAPTPVAPTLAPTPEISKPSYGPTLAPVVASPTSFNITYIDDQVTYYFGVVNTYANLATSWVAYISIFTASMSVAFPFLGVSISILSNIIIMNIL